MYLNNYVKHTCIWNTSKITFKGRLSRHFENFVESKSKGNIEVQYIQGVGSIVYVSNHRVQERSRVKNQRAQNRSQEHLETRNKTEKCFQKTTYFPFPVIHHLRFISRMNHGMNHFFKSVYYFATIFFKFYLT
ncbi:unnamed protein product [Spodoptera littoralis]|uniref:Uncharacterized protein n=1 Tax=Spodoptera littoralis TaxID=7109 RepID=A0A9P0HUE6_SPOLI|nr:unnamed protein product [Spodoptera littoralis]CAH1634702.1 unnamed protein product [Spodoptera littoralis]